VIKVDLKADLFSYAIDEDKKHYLELILPLFSVLLKPPIMRTSCLAAGPLSSVAQTSSG